MFTYTRRSESAARLLICTSSPCSVTPTSTSPPGSSASKFFSESGQNDRNTRSPTTRLISAAVIRRCREFATRSCTSSTPLRAATSSTNPGLGICVSVLSRVEGDLRGAQSPGVERVVDGPPPRPQRVHGADHALDRRVRREVHGQVERPPWAGACPRPTVHVL